MSDFSRWRKFKDDILFNLGFKEVSGTLLDIVIEVFSVYETITQSDVIESNNLMLMRLAPVATLTLAELLRVEKKYR